MSTNINDDDALDAAEAAAAALPLSASEAVPSWVKEGTADDEDDIPAMDVSAAKPMDRSQDDWIPPAKGVVFTIDKAVIETITPKNETEWKLKKMNVWLKVRDGIVYKTGEKPLYKGKMLFHRVIVAVNRQAEKDGIYDFSTNAKGEATDYWSVPGGSAWGEYNALLTALGFSTAPTPQNNKAFRDSLAGRELVADVLKVGREGYDAQQKKYVKSKDEFENLLSNVQPVKAAPQAAAPAVAAAATADVADWDKES